MAGFLCCSSPSTWTSHSEVVVRSATLSNTVAPSALCPGDNQQEAQHQLWEDLFSNSSEWWDNRHEKRSARHPDFRHKITRQPLWLNNRHKPTWVDSQLAILDAHGVEEGSWGKGTSRPCDDAIRSFCEEGQLETALVALCSLDERGIAPSVETYRSLLKACAKKKALAEAKQVHAHLAKHELESIGFLGDSVVKTLVKCGSLKDALLVFYRLPKRTAVSWTAVISGYTDSGQGQEAFRMYKCMRDEGLEPNKYTLVSLIRACASLSDLTKGKQIHAEALKFRSAFDSFVGTCLIDMYGKCGSIINAQNVFDELAQRDVVSWNAMLTAYTQVGQVEKTLQLYMLMQQDGVSSNGRSFVSALQACGMLAEKEEEVVVEGHSIKPKALENGKAVHADAQRRGYDSDVFVGNTLVSMYGKCGSNVDAQNAFYKMSQRDVVAWTAMLTVYGEQGQWVKALLLYEQMQEDCVSPNDRTFVIALQACRMLAEKEEIVYVDGESTKVKSLGQGKVIHAEAWRKGHDSNVFVASTLVSMYGTCRSIVDARNAFNRMSHCDIASWNAMLLVCIEQGSAEEALQWYEHMLQEGMSPDARTCVMVLQACSMLSEKESFSDVDRQPTRLKCLEQGKTVHAAVKRKGYDSDVFIGSTLVSLYGKCGSIVDAQNVFDGLSHHDVVAWNSMVTTYVQHGEAEEALQLYEQMQKEGVNPNDRTFVSALQACGILAEKEDEAVVNGQSNKVRSLERGRAIHANVQRHGYAGNVFVANTLVSMYGKCGSIFDAQNVFDGLSHRDVVSWNAMLVACIEQGQARRALQLYKTMKEEAVSPDTRTFVSALQACGMLAEMEDDLDLMFDAKCSKLTSLEQGRAIHDEAKRRGCDSDVFVSSTLISMYGKCGSIGDAKNVFLGLSKRSVVSWNAMLVAHVQQGQGEMALQLYNEMQQEGVSPDEITLLCVLQACSNTGGLTLLRQIHHHLPVGDGLSRLLASTLIHAYGKCASMADAQASFDAMNQTDVVLWTALMAGYARAGDYAASMHCFDQMQLAGVKPNAVTFVLLVSACSYTGLVDRGVEYFESMSRDYSITPQIEHYVSMIDLLGRAGCFQRIEELLSTLPLRPSVGIWLCVLGACQKHKKVVLGRQAFDSAIHLTPTNPAPYMLMWNIYADAGLWDLAKEVNELRRKAGAWKEPGQSWLEHDQEVKAFFVVGNRNQRAEEQLCGLLSILSEGMKQDVQIPESYPSRHRCAIEERKQAE